MQDRIDGVLPNSFSKVQMTSESGAPKKNGYHGCEASGRLKTTCQRFQWESEAPAEQLGFGSAGGSPSRYQQYCRSLKQNKAIESTVIWIGKDSESESNKYLEECNTHQSGE